MENGKCFDHITCTFDLSEVESGGGGFGGLDGGSSSNSNGGSESGSGGGSTVGQIESAINTEINSAMNLGVQWMRISFAVAVVGGALSIF